MSSLWHKIKGLGKKIKKETSNILKGTGIYTGLTGDLAGGSILAGATGTVSGLASIPDSEYYKMMEGYIPFTNINPIDRYLGKDVAKMNFEQQQKAYEYQKWLNEQQMKREDEAYQRKLKDMTTAGFNPILASGGSGEATSPLRAGTAPQMADTSHALREGIGQALSIMTGFAGLNKMKAETSLLKSQADYQNIVNSHEDNLLALREEAEGLANAFSRGTFDSRVKDWSQKVSQNDKNLVLSELEINWKKLDIDSKKLDNAYKRLENYYFEQESDRKLMAMSIAIMQDWSEYEAFQFKRKFYEEDFNVPVGFDPSNTYLASVFIGRNGDKVLDYLKQFGAFLGIDKVFDKVSSFFGGNGESSNSMPYSPYPLKRPDVSGLFNRYRGRMHDSADYGARRNAFSSYHWYD